MRFDELQTREDPFGLLLKKVTDNPLFAQLVLYAHKRFKSKEEGEKWFTIAKAIFDLKIIKDRAYIFQCLEKISLWGYFAKVPRTNSRKLMQYTALAKLDNDTIISQAKKTLGVE